MKPKAIIPLLCVLFCLFSCKEDDEPKVAPPITEVNTFSCKINGELFVPEDHYHGFNYNYGIGAYILADNSWSFQFADKRRDIYIYIYNVTGTGDYVITASGGYNPFFVGQTENLVEMTDNYVPGADYVSGNNNETVEVLELDLDTRIILQFDQITLINNTNPQDVIVLTEGKLNIDREVPIE